MEDYTRKSDQELQLIAQAIEDERARREAVPPEDRPDPKIQEALRKRHELMYGNNDWWR